MAYPTARQPSERPKSHVPQAVDLLIRWDAARGLPPSTGLARLAAKFAADRVPEDDVWRAAWGENFCA
jgi:hypothetical protein